MVETASNPHTSVGALLLLCDEPHKLFRFRRVGNAFRRLAALGASNILDCSEKALRVDLIVGNCVLFRQIIRSRLMDSKRYPISAMPNIRPD